MIRRLSRKEWYEIKSTGTISIRDVIAVIVVPPPNKDPATGKRPEVISGGLSEEQIAAMLISQKQSDSQTPSSSRPHIPTSTLYLTSSPHTSHEDFKLYDQTHLPHHRIPWYNAAPLFPIREQRAELRRKLSAILESNVRREKDRDTKTYDDNGDNGLPQQTGTDEAKEFSSDSKPSHAYAILSSPETLTLADSVPLAIALWRLRMWEGEGWNLGAEDRWERHFFSPSPS